MTNKDKAKAEIVKWMLETLISNDNVSEENLEAFRLWLVENSNAEVKFEALRQIIETKSLTAFNQADVDMQLEIARERWRIIAPKLGMNPELNHYRRLRTERSTAADTITPVSRPIRKQANKQTWRRYTMIAAVLFLPVMTFFGTYFLLDGRKDAADTTLLAKEYVATDSAETGSDSIRHINLVDGTQVTLNRNSKLSWNESREAELNGEAYFKVAKDTDGKPFVIHSDHLTVTVLGTEFNFRNDAVASKLSLYEGCVQLEHDNGTYLLAETGNEFILDHATGKFIVDDFNTSVEREWLAADKLYKYHSLDEIIDMIEEKYGVEFEGLDKIDMTQKISFRLQDGTSLDAILSILKKASGDFDYTINEEAITLEPLK